MRYFFPIHLNSGNRGCEGIAKGTAFLLQEPKDNLISLSTNINVDKQTGLSQYVTLKNVNTYRKSIFVRAVRKILRKFGMNFKNYDFHEKFLKDMTKSDILISTGGDMLCYGNNQVISTNNYASEKGYKTVLWGCSMGEENMTPEKEATLRKFSLIYSRESLTYHYLKDKVGLNNVVLYPDPAFVLDAEPFELPEFFRKKSPIIGINISNFTIGSDATLDTPFGQEVIDLINYIMNQTDYDILLIPHVFWKDQDDMNLALLIIDRFKSYENRIHVLESDKLNYLQIRYAISKCELFIGARTHAMISAYKECVPSLALGYSIKSRGIAIDLGLPDNLIFNSKNFGKGDLIKSFQYLDTNKISIKNQLRNTLPEYVNRIYGIRNDLKNFIK